MLRLTIDINIDTPRCDMIYNIIYIFLPALNSLSLAACHGFSPDCAPPCVLCASSVNKVMCLCAWCLPRCRMSQSTEVLPHRRTEIVSFSIIIIIANFIPTLSASNQPPSPTVLGPNFIVTHSSPFLPSTLVFSRFAFPPLYPPLFHLYSSRYWSPNSPIFKTWPHWPHFPLPSLA